MITWTAAGTVGQCSHNLDQSRKALVELLSQSKLLMDAELAIDESGRRKFTGHTFRGQGAQSLAAMGLELSKTSSWPNGPHRS